MNATKKTAKRNKRSRYVSRLDGRGASRDEGARQGAEGGRRAAAGQGGRRTDVLAKIAEMPKSDRVMAERIHAIVKASAPDLSPKTWYGMPAYARDGKVICFFKPADKFKTRYATFGFNEDANLDEGSMWATSWAPDEADRRRRGKDRRSGGAALKKAWCQPRPTPRRPASGSPRSSSGSARRAGARPTSRPIGGLGRFFRFGFSVLAASRSAILAAIATSWPWSFGR